MSDSRVPRVLNPFRDTAWEYRRKGFLGTLTLPYRMKETPESHFTGREAPYPTKEKIEEWCSDGQKHNICVRLAGVDKETELLGIDVDDYLKGTKKKDGGNQLSDLESNLGALPETWISTARLDGISGIRFYRVPRNLVFRGKAHKDIEIIQKRHRYSVVWPSLHPEGGTYWWFPPGIKPDKEGKKVWDGELPNAKEFPMLPDAWVTHLSNNRMIMPKDGLIDMEVTVDEAYDWATATFIGSDDDDDPTNQMCTKMQEKLDKHLDKLKSSATFHDLLINAHWNLLNLAFEGHHGWNEAINIYEGAWSNAVIDRGGTTVRSIETLHGEIFRSRIQALRQIKAHSDDRVSNKATPIDPDCEKIGICGSNLGNVTLTLNVDGGSDRYGAAGGDDGGGDETSDVPRGAVKPVGEYETNDDGNAKHFFDMYSTITGGSSTHFIEGLGWIVWHESGTNPDANSYWEVDPDGNQIMRRMWQKVKDRQAAYAEACFGDYLQKLEDEIRGTNNVTKADVNIAKAKYQKWQKWSESSGNNRQAENALKALQSLPGVTVALEDLNNNEFLLGVGNGVLELDRDNVYLRKANKSDLITMNTGVNWEPPSQHSKNIWQNYLDTFVPDVELQKCLQVAMGYCLLGGNRLRKAIIFKGPTTSGKSTMVDAIIATLGDYGSPVSQSLFENHKLNPVLGNALKKRFVGCSEFDNNDSLSASQFKKITGGETIQVELKNSNKTIEAIPHFVPAIATNEVPRIEGGDKALEIRLHVFPFKIQVPKTNEDLKTIIETTCKTAILSWMVEGYVEYRRLGELPVVPSMEEERKSFMRDLDDVQTFFQECVEKQTSPQGYVKKDSMYMMYCRWCDENGIAIRDRVSKPMLGKKLRGFGVETKEAQFRVNGEKSHWWIGVKIIKPERTVIDASIKFNTNVENKNEPEKPENPGGA